MKKLSLFIMFLSLGLSTAWAGNTISDNRPVTPAAFENNFRTALWYNSENRAGLAFSPMSTFNDLHLTYAYADGQFRPQSNGQEIHKVNLNTSGAVWIGKFMLLGNFSFVNKFENGNCFNTVQYELDDHMPYFIMDKNPSKWVKQEYDLGASLVSPVVAERISFGLKVHYLTKVGAKQKDPRAETYKYNIEIIPSLAIDLGKTHMLGIYGMFDNRFERSIPALNNYMVSQKIVYNKGLGEGIIGKVGDNDGLKTIFYKGMRYGGGLQYSWGSKTQFLLDLNYTGNKVDGFEYPTLPKRLGSTKGNQVKGALQVIFGEAAGNKFTFEGLYHKTTGTEHIQKMNNEAFNQRWEIISSNVMVDMSDLHVRLEYDHLFGNDKKYGYDWKIGSSVQFNHKYDTYLMPLSSYSATNLLFLVNGGKQFKFRTSTLLLELNLGYNVNLGGAYKYGGNKKESVQVAYYTAENAYLNRDFLKTGGRIVWTYTARKVNWFIDLHADWAKPFEIQDDRLLCNASVGIVF